MHCTYLFCIENMSYFPPHTLNVRTFQQFNSNITFLNWEQNETIFSFWTQIVHRPYLYICYQFTRNPHVLTVQTCKMLFPRLKMVSRHLRKQPSCKVEKRYIFPQKQEISASPHSYIISMTDSRLRDTNISPKGVRIWLAIYIPLVDAYGMKGPLLAKGVQHINRPQVLWKPLWNQFFSNFTDAFKKVYVEWLTLGNHSSLTASKDQKVYCAEHKDKPN